MRGSNRIKRPYCQTGFSGQKHEKGMKLQKLVITSNNLNLETISQTNFSFHKTRLALNVFQIYARFLRLVVYTNHSSFTSLIIRE